jgi:hypothetical protein
MDFRMTKEQLVGAIQGTHTLSVDKSCQRFGPPHADLDVGGRANAGVIAEAPHRGQNERCSRQLFRNAALPAFGTSMCLIAF